MSTNNKNSNPEESGGPKFQSYWIYAIMSVVLLALVLTNWGTGASSEIQLNRLNDMIKDNAVQSIKLVNGDRAEIYIKEDKKSQPAYEDAAPEGMGGSRYDYYLEVADPGSFNDFINKAYEEQGVPFADRVRVDAERRTDYLGNALQWLLPLAVIAFIWIILMRRLGSGGWWPRRTDIQHR